MAVIDKIRELNQNAPSTEPIRKWKEAGGKVVGWYCSWNYIPEEIIWATGMLPVRIMGDGVEPQLKEADNYLHADSCSFSRSCFERALLGQFSFLDGVVASSSCDGTRRFADVWKTYMDIPLIYVVDMPWKLTDRAKEFYSEEITELKKRLEKHFNVNITPEALSKSIELYNRTRLLLKELQDLRKAEKPPISGSEVIEMLNLAVKMPRPELNTLLEELLKERKKLKEQLQEGVGHHKNVILNRSPERSEEAMKNLDSSVASLLQNDIIQQSYHHDKVRLMLQGSILNNADFVRGIENMGANVVADSLGNGAGYWWGQVEENHASLEAALADYYFSKFPDPRSHPTQKRFDTLSGIAQDFRVEGVISQVIRFCAPLLFDQSRFRDWLAERNIPVLELDVEYGMPLIGGVKTRVEAFLEIVREKREGGR